jgi:riboflavin synthase
MFTGIIEGLGTLTSVRPSGQGRRISIRSEFSLNDTKIGDSIAVNGACLTAVSIEGRQFEVDMSPETVQKTTFSKSKPGDRLNLERALRMTDRLDGHLVSGHIDGTGDISAITKTGNAVLISVTVSDTLSRYMIPKGSVALDGVSLTINRLERNSFEVSIIPHTARLTTIGFRRVGDPVNIETDMIGKYVERFMTHDGSAYTGTREKASGVDMEFLAKNNFL